MVCPITQGDHKLSSEIHTGATDGANEAISGFKLEIDIVQNIIKDYTDLANSGKTIILCWIHSHVNIHGNDRADTAAKSALSLTSQYEASST